MSNNEQLYFATLRRAADLVGEQELAMLLRVTPSHLALWLQRRASPPVDVFLRAVDIVAAYEQAPRSEQPNGNAPGTPGDR